MQNLISKEREAFEEWYSAQLLPTVPHSGGYTKEALEWAYQAAYKPRIAVDNLGDVERVAKAIFPLISGDPEDDERNPFIQSIAKAAIKALTPKAAGDGKYISMPDAPYSPQPKPPQSGDYNSQRED